MARRREGGKGDVEFLPESVVTVEPGESPLEGDYCVEGSLAGEEATCERKRYEVSLLDLPRGRVHRKGKKSTTSVLDGDFEWIGRNQGGRGDDEWELETAGERGVWREVGRFEDEDKWEELDDGEDERGEKDGQGQTVRATTLTYAEKVQGWRDKRGESM